MNQFNCNCAYKLNILPLSNMLLNYCLISVLYPGVVAICCYRKEIIYTSKTRERCDYIPGSFKDGKIDGEYRCRITVCGNGQPPRRGIFCGVKSCNMFGCLCLNGCVPGNAYSSFLERHHQNVSMVYRTFFDRVKLIFLAGLQ